MTCNLCTADRAYSLYNGFTFTNAAKLELQMYRDRRLDEEANANLLEVNGLPEYFDDNKLYDIFRPFGPLFLCKCVMIDGLFKGNGFIQFFRQNNSDEAQNNLVFIRQLYVLLIINYLIGWSFVGWV